MSEVAPQLASEADYLALEPAGDTRYELLDGVIVATTGASKRHDQVSSNWSLQLMRPRDRIELTCPVGVVTVDEILAG